MCRFYRFSKLYFAVFCVPMVFGNVQNPVVHGSRMTRVYTAQDVHYSIKHGACQPHYAEISMENRIPEANQYLTQFSYKVTQQEVFTHPYLGNIQQPVMKITMGYDSTKKAIVTIPIDMEIPDYTRSLGLILGGDGKNQDILYIIIQEDNKIREIPLIHVFSTDVFQNYIIPLDKNPRFHKRILKKLVIRHRFNKDAIMENFYALLGNVAFYSFRVKTIIQSDILEPEMTILSWEEDKKNYPPGFNYVQRPYGLWNQDDTFYMSVEDLPRGTLELYLSLQDRIQDNFMIRLPIAPNHQTAGEEGNLDCITFSLPYDIIQYQQSHSGGTYFALKGMRIIPLDDMHMKIHQSYLQKNQRFNYQYPIEQ